MNFLKWYFSLPTMRKRVGMFDKYKRGKVSMLEYNGECIVIWVKYKNKTVAYKTSGV